MSGRTLFTTPKAREVLVAAFFALTTVVHTWPIAADPSRAFTRNPDTVVHLWVVDEMSRQLVSAPMRPFDGRTFHPYPDALAAVDHVFAGALLAVPLRLFTDRSVLIYNLVLLATFALSGYFTCLLVRALTGSTAAGLVSGCAFAYASVRWNHLPHLHLLSAQWLPLALLMLHRALAAPGLKSGALLAASGALVALSSWHMALLGGVAVSIVAMWTMVARRGALRRQLAALLLAGAAVLACIVPIAVVYARVAEAWRPVSTPAGRANELSSLSLKAEGLVGTVATGTAPYAEALSAFGEGESLAFPGVVTLGLALVPFIAVRVTRRRTTFTRAAWILATAILVALVVSVIGAVRLERPGLAGHLALWAPVVWLSATLLIATVASALDERRSDGPASAAGSESISAIRLPYAVLALAGILLALGPQVEAFGVSLGSGIYREDLIKVLSIIRVPARFVLLTALALAVLAGIGLKLLADRVPARGRFALILGTLLLLNVELFHGPHDLRSAPRARPVDSWLERLEEPGAVIEYPMRRSLWAVYAGLHHGRPLVNGVGYLQPPAVQALYGDDELSPRQLDVLWEHLHPRFILVYGEQYEGAEQERVLAATDQPGTLIPRAQFGATRVLELVDRGAGPVLYRRWPRRSLENATTLAFSASVADSPPGTVSTLTVDLNGHRLLEQHGPEASSRRPYQLALPRGALVDGINTFHIRGDYRIESQARAHALGTTGAAVLADIAARAAPDGSFIQVNGRRIAVDKGYGVVVIDPRIGTITGEAMFNTSWHSEDSERMAEFIDGVPAGAVVVIASEYDAARQLTARAVQALSQLGLSGDVRGRFGHQHAGIGLKGAAPGSGLEDVGEGVRQVTLGNPTERPVQLEGLLLR